MSSMASQITSLTIVCSNVYLGVDQRKQQSSASLAVVRGIHRWPVNSPDKGPVTRKMYPFDDVIMFDPIDSQYLPIWVHGPQMVLCRFNNPVGNTFAHFKLLSCGDMWKVVNRSRRHYRQKNNVCCLSNQMKSCWWSGLLIQRDMFRSTDDQCRFHTYEIDTGELNDFDLNDNGACIIDWIGILMELDLRKLKILFVDD